METKQEIRERIKQERFALPKREWMEKSMAICRKIVSHPLFLLADEILIYMDMKKEVCTKPIILAAWEKKKKVAIPRMEKENMEFYEISGFEETKKGMFGVQEPTTSVAAKGKNALMILPGVAFDKKRNRVGYGGGYYDRYLQAHKGIPTIAVSFEFQVADNVPAEPHDIRPEILVTENAVYQERKEEKHV